MDKRNQMRDRIDLTRDQKASIQQSELRALQERQIAVAAGHEKPEMIEANRNPKYQIRTLESERYVHVWTRVKNLDSAQKEFIFDDRIIKIHAREFDARVRDGAFKTYDEVEVIHDPRKNAPKEYNLKPSQIGTREDNVQNQVDKSSGKILKQLEVIEREKQRVNKQAQDLQVKEDGLSLREQDLQAREQALAQREAAANAPGPKAPEGPLAPEANNGPAIGNGDGQAPVK